MTLSSTAIVVDPLTATITDVTSDITSVTATALLTQTTVFTETVTVPVTQTRTVTASAALLTADVPAFRANAFINGKDMYLYTFMSGPVNAQMYWSELDTSTNPTVENKFIWKIDSNGHLMVANPAVGGVTLAPWVMASGDNPQISRLTDAQTRVANGNAAFIKAAVDPATNKLYLEGFGRKNLMLCAVTALYLSAGTDRPGSVCQVHVPTISYV